MASSNQEPIALVVHKLKGLAKSTQHFTNGLLDHFVSSRRRHPIEILKRLQREAFTDIMKLRDRQDKVERILSFKSAKTSPFDEASTRVRGEIEALGMLLMIDRINEGNQEAVDGMGIKSGVNSRFSFETTVREKDLLTAELVAKGQVDGPLSLAKVVYSANVNDWCSLVAVPLGGKCSDVGLTGYSCTGPPLLNKHIGSGVGLTVKKSNCIASLAQFVTQLDSAVPTHWLSTLAQVTYQLSWGTKVSLLGLNKTPKFLSQNASVGPIALPVGGLFRRHKEPMEADDGSIGSAALVLESDLDSSTKVGGWIEMSNSDSRYLQWGVSVSDLPEDDIGWGLKVGGSADGSNIWDRYQVEAFSKVKFGEKLLLQPSLVYVKDGSTKLPALVMKSSWSF
ncbi:hypothetical protein M8C21_009645 [Ambrosia artemisiifolia]|uniref:Uncharacterized protein n=1 Tax=Ambrosia artemisiifolia TaxID=4212 RepID=A0AAD5DGJ8_AMBAR|nr:hypothetical protein M8C21_009645 [Ambrosia artemisiifolia]